MPFFKYFHIISEFKMYKIYTIGIDRSRWQLVAGTLTGGLTARVLAGGGIEN